MTRRDRLVYGCYDPAAKVYRVSDDPPDAPVRRMIDCGEVSEVNAFAKRRRARVVWIPRPPREAQLQ
jgi:hypothetical protein